jgi:hypothetical protein
VSAETITDTKPLPGTVPAGRATAVRGRKLGIIAGLALLGMGPALGAAKADPVNAGYRDFSYGSSISAATGEKPESKLWWNDGYWWSALWDTTAAQYAIHRLDPATQSWVNTGVGVDNRSNTRADALWDGQKLYVVSHVFSTVPAQVASGNSARLYRYSYSAVTDQYTLDSGFPVLVNSSRSEALVLDKDSTGRLWITWVQDQKVKINRSTTSDLSWGTPFDLPVQGSLTNADDISSLVAFGGDKIGVLWSNQDDRKFYFATHTDGQPDTVWNAREEAVADTGVAPVADDHLCLKAACGTAEVYAVAKTSHTAAGEPLVLLAKRDSGGTWSRHVVGNVEDDLTRPILAVDPSAGMVHVVAMSDKGGKNIVYLKSASFSDLQFPTGLGTPLIDSDLDSLVNNPTSTKQCVNATTDLVVLASDQGTRYYLHGHVNLAPGAPTITSFSPSSGAVGTEVEVHGSGFTDATGVAFNGVAASLFTVESDALLRAEVPAGATTGKLSVTNSSGTGTSAADFVVLAAPSVTSFSPTSGPVGTLVTVQGRGFSGATGVAFNGVAAKSFTIETDTILKVHVPTGASTGRISVTNDVGVGESAEDFEVTPPTSPLVIYPVGDAQVSLDNPDANYGLLPTMRIRGEGEVWSSFVKFDVLGIGAPVVSASLRLYVTDPSNDGGSAYAVANDYLGTTTAWTDAGITWNNAPAIEGTPLASAGSVALDSWGDLDVAAALVGDSTYSFGLESGSSNSAIFSTREGFARPALVIHLEPMAAPVVTSFTPEKGPHGTLVEVRGEGFASATGVAFDGTAAPGFVFEGDTLLRVKVPAGATTGPLTVTNPAGTGAGATDFVVEPTVTAFSPTSGPAGTMVELHGTGFATATAVAFNGVDAPGFTVDSDTLLHVAVPAGATTGKLSVTNPAGTGFSADSFTVIQPPAIASFSPASGAVGTEVTVQGTSFGTASAVAFNGAPAAFVVDSDTLLRAVAPDSATSGPISVTNPAGTATSADSFTVIPPPTIASFDPTSGPVGTEVTVTGSGLTGATTVAFNGVSASLFTVDSDTQLRATVPDSATSGPISVSNAAGTGTSADSFTVIPPPTIASFDPTSGPVGTEVTVTGSGFSGTTAVAFNGTAALFTVDGDFQLRATVPDGATSGPISVSNAAGTATSADSFTVIVAPVIASFDPTSGLVGTEVTVAGSGFSGTTAVAFNGTAALFTVDSDAQIRATVPDGATSGPISVTNPAGTGTSADSFTVIPPPTIASFDPPSGPEGALIDVLGTGFATATAVAVNGTAATDFTVESDTLLHVVVPTGATTGKLSVTNPAGTGTSEDDFVVVASVSVPLPTGSGIPKVYGLQQNRPNPAGVRTEIHFQIPQTTHVNLAILDIQGRAVRELVSTELQPGFFQVTWDGRDRDGHAVSNGTYIFMLNAGTFRQARKMVVIR